MKIFIRCIICSIIISLNSCSNNKNSDEKDTTIQISLHKGIGTYNENDYFDSEALIPLETTDSSLIGSIHKLIRTKNGFVILDIKQKCIFLFSDNGKFIKKICSVGKGPEQYVYLSDLINSPNGGFYGLDNRSKYILEYNAEGTFLKKFSFANLHIGPVHSFQHIRNNVFAFFSRNDVKMLVLYDIENDTILDYIQEEQTLRIIPNVGLDRAGSYPFIQINKTLCFYENYDNVIYKIEQDKILPYRTLHFLNEKFIHLEDFPDVKNARDYWNILFHSDIISLHKLFSIDHTLIFSFRKGTKGYIAICDLEKKKVKVCNSDEDTDFHTKTGSVAETTYSILNPAKPLDFDRINELSRGTDIQVNINDNYYLEKIRLRTDE